MGKKGGKKNINVTRLWHTAFFIVFAVFMCCCSLSFFFGYPLFFLSAPHVRLGYSSSNLDGIELSELYLS